MVITGIAWEPREGKETLKIEYEADENTPVIFQTGEKLVSFGGQAGIGLMTNAELFNQVIGEVLSMIYARFPIPCSLAFSDCEETANISDSGATEKDIQINAMRWMRDEGYLRFEFETNRNEIHGIILTEKGLAALNAIPSGLSGNNESEESIGEFLADAVNTGIKERISEAVKSFIAAGTRIAANGIGT